MEQFLNRVKDKKIIIFGTGVAGRAITEQISYDVQYYVDNNFQKWEKEFLGKKIYSTNRLHKENRDNIAIFVASMYYDEISRQLIDMGFEQDIHFFNLLELLFNPLNHNDKKVIYEEGKYLDIKVKKLIKFQCFQDAKRLIEEYEKLIPLDSRVCYLKALIEISENNIEVAKEYLLNGFKNSNFNIDVHQNYKCAENNMKEKKYLKAIEMYEKVLTSVDSEKIKNEVERKIDNIYEQYRLHIQRQLKEYNQKVDSTTRINDFTYVHFILDSVYCKKFIESIERYHNINQHLFLVFSSDGNLNYIEDNRHNLITIRNTGLNNEEIVGEIRKYLNKADKIFIHYLTDFICWLICKIDIKENLYWILWGGDFFPMLDIDLYDQLTTEFLKQIALDSKLEEQRNCQIKKVSMYRKSAVRRISNILMWSESDYKLIKDKFVTKAERRDFFYLNPVDFTIIESAITEEVNKKYYFKSKYKYIFLLGNSGSPRNNHLEILSYFKNIKRKDFCVITPLTYGDRIYTQELIKEGKKMLGDQFISLTEFLKPEEYARILNQVDVAIMNHNIREGFGNVRILLYLGKKVYVKKQKDTLKSLNEIGLKLFDVENLKIEKFENIIKLDRQIKLNNKMKIVEEQNEERYKILLSKLL